jgi:diguanylate cyclase (GGDEF)-like protein
LNDHRQASILLQFAVRSSASPDASSEVDPPGKGRYVEVRIRWAKLFASKLAPMGLTIRNLKVRDQILLVTLPPLFVLLCAIGLIYYSFQSALSTERAATKTRDSVLRSDAFLRHTSDASMAVRRYIFNQQREALAAYDTAMTEGRADIIALHDMESDAPDESGTILQIQAAFEELQKQWAIPVIDRVRQGKTFDIASSLADGEDRMATIRTQILRLQGDDERDNEFKVVAAEKLMKRVLAMGIGMAVLLATMLLFLTNIVTRQIVRPVHQLIGASEQVAQGNLAPKLPPPLQNEFGVLSRSFAQMTAALQREREDIASLNRFYESVSQARLETEVYDLILHSLKDRFQPRQIIIFESKLGEGYLEVASSLAPLSKEFAAWPVISDGQNCKAVRVARPFVVNDTCSEPLCPSKFAPPAEGSYYCSPLVTGDMVIGAVRVEAAKDLWTPERQRLLESYLSGAASSLSNLRLLDRMRKQANIDVLTGLYNRRFLEDYARKIFAIAERREQPTGVLMLDLDHFKSFNDVYGHEMGDRILRQFAKTITSSMRETNLAARYGGEEFVVILPDTDTKSCILVAERIRKAVGNMKVSSTTDKSLPQLTASIGVASFPTNGQTPEEVIQASDKALYESKRAGRNRVTVAAISEATLQ